MVLSIAWLHKTCTQTQAPELSVKKISLLKTSFSEKTKNDPPIKTAYVTMSGDAMMSEDIHLSHSLDEINSGEIGCLLGHPESFLSTKGIYSSLKHKYNNKWGVG